MTAGLGGEACDRLRSRPTHLLRILSVAILASYALEVFAGGHDLRLQSATSVMLVWTTQAPKRPTIATQHARYRRLYG